MKLQSLTIGSVIMALGIAGVTAMGCTATASGGVTGSSGGHVPPGTGAIPAGCSEDASLVCTADAIGISCPTGTAPDDPTLECSDPTPGANGDGYCCIAWVAGGDCTPDGTVAGCAVGSYGFSCTAGAAPPDAADSTLVCSTPTPSGSEDLYCCADNFTGGGSSSGSTGTGCAPDSTLACDAGSDGVTCASPSDNPEADFPGYICSDPSPQSDGSTGYCCATGFTGSTCAQDDSVAGCAFPSVGFSCTGTDTPDQADSALVCSDPTIDPNTGDSLYCCQ